MLTIEKLRACGANVQEGMSRCMNNEAFYLRLTGMALDDKNFGKLNEAIGQNDKKAAFEAAHALKGMLGNLSLTPLVEPVTEITELLRAEKDADYPALCAALADARAELLRLRDE